MSWHGICLSALPGESRKNGYIGVEWEGRVIIPLGRRSPAFKLQSREAQIGDLRIHYQVGGTGKPIVFIHGLGGSTRWWSRNVEAFARRYRVYVVDLVGFGASQCGHPFVLADAASYLSRWMTRVGIQQATVVGHSMGGYIAAELAADYPHKVDKLILVDAAAAPFDPSYVKTAVGMVSSLRSTPLSLLSVMVTDSYKAGPRTIVKAAMELKNTDLRAKLRRIQAPTLIVWGENDTVTPRKMADVLRQAIPGAEFKLMKRVGHSPMWERPAEFNQTLLHFLGEAPAILRTARTSLPPRDPWPHLVRTLNRLDEYVEQSRAS